MPSSTSFALIKGSKNCFDLDLPLLIYKLPKKKNYFSPNYGKLKTKNDLQLELELLFAELGVFCLEFLCLKFGVDCSDMGVFCCEFLCLGFGVDCGVICGVASNVCCADIGSFRCEYLCLGFGVDCGVICGCGWTVCCSDIVAFRCEYLCLGFGVDAHIKFIQML